MSLGFLMPHRRQPLPDAAQGVSRPARAVLLPVLLCVAILAGGGYLLARHVLGVTQQEEEELSTIANLKAGQVATWYAGLQHFAERMRRNRVLQEQFLRVVEGTATAQTRADLQAWMGDLGEDGYAPAALFDRSGRVRLASAQGAGTISLDASDPDFRRALDQGDVLVQGFHRDAADRKVHLSVWVPVTPRNGGPARGLFLFQVDASRFLEPFLGTWPTASGSAETQLVERSGNAVVYLNPQRFTPAKGFTLRIPIRGHENHPAVMAVLGREGLVTGPDYRKVMVLAALRKIPGTPWALVAKMDRSEVYEAARREGWFGVLALLLLSALVAIMAAFLFHRRALWEAQEMLRLERATKGATDRARHLMEQAHDIILVLGTDGRILEANPRAVEAYGYSLQDLLGMTILDLRASDTRNLAEVQIAQVRAGASQRFEALHRRSDGTLFPVEVSSSRVTVGEETFLLSFIRDITERKAQEGELQRLTRLYAALSQVNQAIVWSGDRQALLDKICEVMVEFGGFSMAWIGWEDPETHRVLPVARYGDRWGILDRVVVQSDDTFLGHGPLGTAIREARPCLLNDYQAAPEGAPWRTELQASGLASIAAFPIRQSGAVVGGIAVYSTEKDFFGLQEMALLEEAAGDVSFALDHLAIEARRAEAEAELHRQERFLREAEEAGRVGCYTWDIQGDHWVGTAQLEQIFGIGPDHPRTLLGWLGLVAPEAREDLYRHVEERIAQHARFDYEYPIIRPADGARRWAYGTGEFTWDADGKAVALTGVIRDVTERKTRELELERLNRLYAALSQVNQVIVRARTRPELLEGVCRALVEHGGFNLAWIGWEQPNTRCVEVLARWGDATGMLDRVVVRTDGSPEGRGAMGPAITLGRPAIFNDLLNDPRSAPWRRELEAAGFKAMAAIPVREGGGVRGGLAVYAREPGFFGPREVSLMEEVATDLSFALDHLAGEAERRAVSEKFANAFQASPDALTINRVADGVYLDVNEGFQAMLGYAPEEALGRSSRADGLDLWARPGDLERLHEVLEREGRVTGQEVLLRRKDGSLITGLMSASYLEVEGQRCSLAITRDITDRKVQEQKLERMTQLYAALSQVNQAIVWSKDRPALLGKICEVLVEFGKASMAWIGMGEPGTSRVVRLADYGDVQGYLDAQKVRSDDTVMGRGPTGIALREGRPCVMNAFMQESATQPWHAAAVRCGYAAAAAFPIRQGGAVWGALTVYAPVEGFFGTLETALLEEAALDISFALDHMADEERRREAEGAQGRLLRILDSSRNEIFVFDAETLRFDYANEGASRNLGYPLDVLRGMTPVDFNPGFTEASFRQAIEPLRAHATDHLRFEAVHRRSDGSQYPVEVHLQMVEEGGRSLFLAVIADITERKRAEDERRDLEIQLLQTQKLESLGALAGGLAHDMNNVLGAILGVASSLREKQGEDGADAKPLDTLIQACLRGRGVVKSLLYFARKDLQEEQPFSLNDLAREMAQLLGQTTLKRVQLELDLRPDLPLVRGDAGALNHALMNLCVNAVDAMPEGGILTLRTETTPEGGVALRVKDTGAGMTPDVLARCKDPFFTTKAKGKGTGLGLPMVHSTMEAHEGRLELHSTPGAGTEAVMQFPPSRRVSEVTASAPQPEPAPVKETGGDALAILLVDDDDLVRDSVHELLELLGHRCTAARGGQEALDLLEAGLGVDLVILDMNMPGMSGAQALPRILDLRPGLEVILATGYSTEDMAPLMQGRSNVQAIAKPFSAAELRARMAQAADRARGLRTRL